MNQISVETNTSNVKIIYFLYLASLVFGITALIGLVMAYLSRDETRGWLKTHYEFLIRTFWISLLYSIIAFALMFVVIGYVLFVLIAIWFIIRCSKGLKALDKQEAIKNPKRWGF